MVPAQLGPGSISKPRIASAIMREKFKPRLSLFMLDFSPGNSPKMGDREFLPHDSEANQPAHACL
jgi:hypothetical protein